MEEKKEFHLYFIIWLSSRIHNLSWGLTLTLLCNRLWSNMTLNYILSFSINLKSPFQKHLWPWTNLGEKTYSPTTSGEHTVPALHLLFPLCPCTPGYCVPPTDSGIVESIRSVRQQMDMIWLPHLNKMLLPSSHLSEHPRLPGPR